jgi:hypothetical protein
MSWSSRIIKSFNNIIYLECKFPDEELAFYVLKTFPNKVESLKEKVSEKLEINLEEFGRVLDSGWGKLPSKYAM